MCITFRKAQRSGSYNARAKVLAGIAAVLAAGLVPTLSLAGPIGTVTADGYTFLNFDGPGSGTMAAAGTNMNGIANSGGAVGFGIDNGGNFTNFVRNPDGSTTTLTNMNSGGGLAFGINSAGDVVGQQNGVAVYMPNGGTPQTLGVGGTGSAAFGVNDSGNIVGQYTTTSSTTPGFIMANHSFPAYITINAPSGPNTVNAQGINNNGLVVGFYVGTDGQDHGFTTTAGSAVGNMVTGTAIGDPTIPANAGEPGATFVFSQVLGVNDSGLAVGYFGDSTTSQHGFLYNTSDGMYTFLDDPAEQFSAGVEVTQITGITDAGELTGFYSDANGVFHGFVACPTDTTCAVVMAPVPEPASLALAGLGMGGFAFMLRRRRAGRRR